MMDWESYRIVTPVTGLTRARVFTLATSFVVQIRIDDYVCREKSFRSFKEVEAFARKRRWRLEKARHFEG